MSAAFTTTLKPLIGVIGGSGLYKLPGLETLETIDVSTPWGAPSSPITLASLPSTSHDSPRQVIAFLARHGHHHTLTPSEVPSIANIAALKHLGVRVVVAFSAVGSLREHLKPRDVVVPNQIIDRTKSLRQHTFFNGLSVVGHVSFGDPFDERLRQRVVKCIRDEVSKTNSDDAVQVHDEATVVCMEGPQFSTRAESEMYRMWGGDIINMSVLPEAKLAREAELAYCLIAQVTDYDSWRKSEESVTVHDVMSTIQSNVALSNRLSLSMLSTIYTQLESSETNDKLIGSTKSSIMTHLTTMDEVTRQKLSFILPDSFP